MSDSPEPTWPGGPDVEALVSRVVAERIDPLRAQLTTLSRAIVILAERVPPPEEVGQLSRQIESLAARIQEAAPTDDRLADLERTVNDNRAEVAKLASLEHTLQDGLAELGAKVSGAAITELAARSDLARRLDGVAARLESSVAPVLALPDQLRDVPAALTRAVEEARRGDAEAREAQADDLRRAVASAVEDAVAQLDRARGADTIRLLGRIASLEAPLQKDADERRSQAEDLRQSVAGAVSAAVARLEASRNADTDRLLERITALEAPLQGEGEARQAQTDELRQALAIAVSHAVAKVDQARGAEASTLHEEVAALAEALLGETEARTAQAAELRSAVAEAIQEAGSLAAAGRAADVARLSDQVAALEAPLLRIAESRQAEADELRRAIGASLDSLGAVVAEQGSGLLAHIDERTAAITDLESIPPLVASEVRNATAAALDSQVQPLVARLVEAIDTLAHEGGRIEAMARAHAGEARVVEDRVAGLFVEVAERAESAVDHSRARIAEGQVALSTRFDTIMGELLTSLTAAADRLEARLAESVEGLRAASGHQNGALLDAVNRSSQQVGEGLTEVRSALYATGTEWASRGAEADRRAEALAERLEALRATVESIRHDPRLEALVVEQVGAREAQLTAIGAVSRRIDEVGPVVARALLSEVERATRAANAAEEAVASLRPEALRSALGDAADEIRSAASRLDETIGTLAEQVANGLASSSEELLTLTAKATERSAALADEVASASATALDDLRASQTVLREAVQDAAHKAELAALDIRGLRERLTPHLVALADATTRRAEADQAGFDAVLARLDQLLAARQP